MINIKILTNDELREFERLKNQFFPNNGILKDYWEFYIDSGTVYGLDFCLAIVNSEDNFFYKYDFKDRIHRLGNIEEFMRYSHLALKVEGLE